MHAILCAYCTIRKNIDRKRIFTQTPITQVREDHERASLKSLQSKSSCGYYNKMKTLLQGKSHSIRACPVIQRGQEHCLAVPQSAGDCTPADCGYETRRLKRRGTSCPQLFFNFHNRLDDSDDTGKQFPQWWTNQQTGDSIPILF